MGFVKVEQQGHVGILTIDRQEALNALNSQVLNDLDAAIDEVAANDDVYVVVLTGAGRSFVAGADIGEMKGFSSADGKKFGVHGGGVFLKLENMAKPVIAAINGFALGGGCELSMACDIRLASEKAKFGQPEVGLGITPGFAGTQRLPRIVGISKAMELILTAKVIGAAEAKAIGLVSEVYPPEELMPKALELANASAPTPRSPCRSPSAASAWACRPISPPAPLSRPRLSASAAARRTRMRAWARSWRSALKSTSKTNNRVSRHRTSGRSGLEYDFAGST